MSESRSETDFAIYLPCKHSVVCHKCILVKEHSFSNCPICKRKIQERLSKKSEAKWFLTGVGTRFRIGTNVENEIHAPILDGSSSSSRDIENMISKFIGK